MSEPDRRQVVADIQAAIAGMRARGEDPRAIYMHPHLLQEIADGVFHVCPKCGDMIPKVEPRWQDVVRERLWRLAHRLNCGK